MEAFSFFVSLGYNYMIMEKKTPKVIGGGSTAYSP